MKDVPDICPTTLQKPVNAPHLCGNHIQPLGFALELVLYEESLFQKKGGGGGGGEINWSSPLPGTMQYSRVAESL